MSAGGRPARATFRRPRWRRQKTVPAKSARHLYAAAPTDARHPGSRRHLAARHGLGRRGRGGGPGLERLVQAMSRREVDAEVA